MKLDTPLPSNELGRLLNLSEHDLDFLSLKHHLKSLTELAAKVAGTKIALVNLIDSETQWTIADYGFPIEQMPRCESVCQYTILGNEVVEISDLSKDERFKRFSYVTGEPALKFYLGIPLSLEDGYNLGALCVLDATPRKLDKEKILMLGMIACEVAGKLKTLRLIESLESRIKDIVNANKKLVHDIRGPIAGIIGLAEILSKPDEYDLLTLGEYADLIRKSGSTVLDLANDILKSERILGAEKICKNQEYNLLVLKGKLERLYLPQAISKQLTYEVTISKETALIPFPKDKLLQIAGNLISNAIKFTPGHGRVSVNISLQMHEFMNVLSIAVADTGIGLTEGQIKSILTSKGESTKGTAGEEGFGLGLLAVKYMIDSLGGQLHITSEPQQGTTFLVTLGYPLSS
jgi:signal transduction histidine kinase